MAKSLFSEFEKLFFACVCVKIGFMEFCIWTRNTAYTVHVFCSFQIEVDGNIEYGHGNIPESSLSLIPFFNQDIKKCYLLESSILFILFEDGDSLRIIPDTDTLTSFYIK